MNVLIIGNSFAATLRQAVSAAHHNVTFAGGSGGVLNNLILGEDGDSLMLGSEVAADPTQQKLWRITTGNAGPLALSGFDYFVVIGLFGPPNPWSKINCKQLAGDIDQVLGQEVPVSFALYRKINPYRLHVARAKKMLEMIRNAGSSRSVLFIPAPHIREDAGDFDSQYLMPEFWQVLDKAQQKTLQENEYALYTRLLREQGAQVMLPPDEVVINGNRCPARYSVGALGSANFESGVKPQWGNTPAETAMNFAHKNTEYGEVLWRYLNSAIDKKCGSLFEVA